MRNETRCVLQGRQHGHGRTCATMLLTTVAKPVWCGFITCTRFTISKKEYENKMRHLECTHNYKQRRVVFSNRVLQIVTELCVCTRDDARCQYHFTEIRCVLACCACLRCSLLRAYCFSFFAHAVKCVVHYSLYAFCTVYERDSHSHTRPARLLFRGEKRLAEAFCR